MKGRHVSDPRYHLGPMEELYDLVFGMVERRFDAETRERFAGAPLGDTDASAHERHVGRNSSVGPGDGQQSTRPDGVHGRRPATN